MDKWLESSISQMLMSECKLLHSCYFFIDAEIYLFVYFFILADIYEKVSEELEKDGHLDCECIGGGRIKHDPQAKKIHVYGYSMVRECSRKTLMSYSQ